MTSSLETRSNALDFLEETQEEVAYPQHEGKRRRALHVLVETSHTSQDWQETAAHVCYEQHFDCLSDGVKEHFSMSCPDAELALRALSGRLEEFDLVPQIEIEMVLLRTAPPKPPKKMSTRKGA